MRVPFAKAVFFVCEKPVGVGRHAAVGTPVQLPLRLATLSSIPYRDPPPFGVTPVRLHGDEPAVPFQNFGRFDRAIPIPDDVRAVDADIPHADDGLGPVVLEPVE